MWKYVPLICLYDYICVFVPCNLRKRDQSRDKNKNRSFDMKLYIEIFEKGFSKTGG